MRSCDREKRYETETVSAAVKKAAVIVDDHWDGPADVADDEALQLAEEAIWCLFFLALWEGPLKIVRSPVDLYVLMYAWTSIPVVHLEEGLVLSAPVSNPVPAALLEGVLSASLAHRLSLIPRVVVLHVSRMARARLS